MVTAAAWIFVCGSINRCKISKRYRRTERFKTFYIIPINIIFILLSDDEIKEASYVLQL
jgi:hypothetical protein